MNKNYRLLKKFFFLFIIILISRCHNPEFKINNGNINKFKISNIENTIDESVHEMAKNKSYNAYRTKFALTNLSLDTFIIRTNRFILPQESICWGPERYKFNNYEFYAGPVIDKTEKFYPMSSVPVRMKVFETSLLDSFLYQPELLLNNRRYRLKFMFRKNEDETGYDLKDSISTAVMMKDTIIDYSNRRIRAE